MDGESLVLPEEYKRALPLPTLSLFLHQHLSIFSYLLFTVFSIGLYILVLPISYFLEPPDSTNVNKTRNRTNSSPVHHLLPISTITMCRLVWATGECAYTITNSATNRITWNHITNTQDPGMLKQHGYWLLLVTPGCPRDLDMNAPWCKEQDWPELPSLDDVVACTTKDGVGALWIQFPPSFLPDKKSKSHEHKDICPCPPCRGIKVEDLRNQGWAARTWVGNRAVH
ncbi:hypothetical protein K491DRAFT_322360 [Lophiostoma macrostomum CBS 122681]|uniref:Uncharacterized protein n=1 Tax=Lophiostoma macrostomum CBS 122681 TaxID=1314788 RepID=A0A6A6SJS4_9PLEO|nr:hypothetical protein K491DRAFT_322360 [Lophiostoma macrostomum CBS 122681]